MSYLAFAPTGTIMFYNKITPPNGWFLCDGQVLNRIAYKELFNAIGTAWGSGDGSTTFNLPNLYGIMLRGRDNGAGRDPARSTRTTSGTGGAIGDNVGSFQSWNVTSHTHVVKSSLTSAAITHGHNIQDGYQDHSHSGSYNAIGDHTHDAGFEERMQGGREGLSNSDAWYATKDASVDTDNKLGDIDHSSYTGYGSSIHNHTVNTDANWDHTHTVSISYTNNGSSDTRPVNASVAYIIKF